MKTWILIISALLVNHFSFSKNLIEKGNDAYASENFEEAIQFYLSDISNGNQSSDLYYNLGNAYYRLNEIGESIWAYQTAIKLNPDNTDAIFNLQFVNEMTVDKIDRHQTGVGSWVKARLFGVNPNFWVYWSWFLSLVLAISLYFFFTKTSAFINTISSLSIFIVGLAFIFTISLSIIQKNQIIQKNHFVITEAMAKIQNEPKQESLTSFELHEGAELNIISENSNWYEVEINGNKGWTLKENGLTY